MNIQNERPITDSNHVFPDALYELVELSWGGIPHCVRHVDGGGPWRWWQVALLDELNDYHVFLDDVAVMIVMVIWWW